MEKDKIKTPAVAKEAYNFEMLLNDIQETPDENPVEMAANDNAEREFQHKLVVMQMLIYLAIVYQGVEYNDEEKLRNAITVKVNNDELLSGYLFHCSQNPQFDYSWNYMRKRKVSYSTFLAEAVRFMKNMLVDVNMLVGKPRLYSDVHMVFDDVFDVALTSDKPYVKASVLWGNFHRVAVVKKDYHISVKVKDSLLVAGTRKEDADAENLINAALEMLKKAIESEKKENEAD